MLVLAGIAVVCLGLVFSNPIAMLFGALLVVADFMPSAAPKAAPQPVPTETRKARHIVLDSQPPGDRADEFLMAMSAGVPFAHPLRQKYLEKNAEELVKKRIKAAVEAKEKATEMATGVKIRMSAKEQEKLKEEMRKEAMNELRPQPLRPMDYLPMFNEPSITNPLKTAFMGYPSWLVRKMFGGKGNKETKLYDDTDKVWREKKEK